MRPLIGRWWHANLYGKGDLTRAFREAGFASIRFGRFPPRFRHLGLWGHVVEAETSPRAARDHLTPGARRGNRAPEAP
jgi:hypothetical protein